MIQRIQSLYLLLTTILSLIFPIGSVLKFINTSGSVIKVTFAGVEGDTDILNSSIISGYIFFQILIILIPVLALITIFLYKNRKVQLWFTRSLITSLMVFICITGYYIYMIPVSYNVSFSPEIQMVIPVISLIFSFLAYRGIKKDDNLVKSYDRLR